MPRKLLQGILARFCIGRPKVADDDEEDDIVGRIAGRLTRLSCTEERWAPDAGSATGGVVSAADSAASADGPAPAEVETDVATPPVAEPERLQSQLQGPAATQHLIETCQAQRWKAIDLCNREAELEVREGALQRHETALQCYAAALQQWVEEAEEDLRQRGQELCQRGKAVKQVDAVTMLQHSTADVELDLRHQKGHHAVIGIHANATAAAQAYHPLNAAQQGKQAEPAKAPTPQRLQAAEYNPSPGWHPLYYSAWQGHQVKQAGHADAVAGRTGDAGRTCRVGRTEVDLLQCLVETAIARALHLERQQAEQQRQLVLYYNAASREVSGVRRGCAEEVARVLQQAAEQQGFFHTAPHQICQDTLVADRVLGQGAFGVAQLCYSPVFGWMVAKVVHDDAESYVPGMYRQEAEMLCGLAHPNIVRGFGLITDAADPTQIRGLLMEELNGDLSSLLAPKNRHMLTHGRLMSYAWQAAKALAYCHAHGIGHLDIKPENFLLSGTEELKLADFGLALRAGPMFAKQALGRGTQGYMAPELTTGLHMASDKADVWSLGMTFYTMVTFHVPYEGLTSEQHDAALRREDWPKWHECDMPAEWSVLLQMCLQWDPAERASMQQLAAFLEEHQY